MADIQEHVSLAPYTTLKAGGPAEYFAVVKSEVEMLELLALARENPWPITVLGGGSNVLIPDDGLRGLVIKNEIKGIKPELAADASGNVLVAVGAGENWDALVEQAVYAGWWGLENLSAIPGSVGATLVQNVGAYGVEIKDVAHSAKVADMATGEVVEMSLGDFGFGYRDSIFKKTEEKKWVIMSVVFKLSTVPAPKLHYKDLAERFAHVAPEKISLPDIRSAVIDIRQNKFPDLGEVGTAGSFFKNPVIGQVEYEELLKTYPELPGYPEADGRVKVSLGWILDHVCGLRGHTEGKVGLYEKQALVLVTDGTAEAEEIKAFANHVMAAVFEKTKIQIEPEVSYL